MKKIFNKKGILAVVLTLFVAFGCDDQLAEMNQNPSAINPADGNVNMLMPLVLGPAAQRYLDLGLNNMAGAMQQLQLSGWAGSVNYYGWSGSDWTGYFDNLRQNDLMLRLAQEKELKFHEGVGLTMRAFLFGQIADYWGDAPYAWAVRGYEGGIETQYPVFDSQETIYMGVIEDLKNAVALFATGDKTFVQATADLYFNGDPAAWERFANSLLIRYYVRISEKKDVKAAVESIVSGGKFIQTSSQDATMDYTGGSSDQWPLIYSNETSSTRYQACKTFIDQMVSTDDPRLKVWFDPARVRWVQDTNVSGEEDAMSINGGAPVAIWKDWKDYRGKTDLFTRRYNPNDVTRDDSEYLGIPAGIFQSENQAYNGNPSPGQGRHNVHVSMLKEKWMDGKPVKGDMLRARLLSSAEMHFTLAEMALKGWSVGGSAQSHYEAGIQNSLNVWGIGDKYDDFIAEVPYAGTVEQIITQKWVAGFMAGAEAWNDYKRTGFPILTVGPGATAPVPAIRFGYGPDELNNNTDNVSSAINNLETTVHSGQLGKDSQYSKQWLLQGTSKPW